MRYYSLIAALLVSVCLFGQGYVPMGARENGMGSAGVTAENSNSFFFNPGSIGSIETVEIGINYQNRFLLKEFSEQTISAIVPLKKGVFSCGMYHAGNTLYQNTRVGAGYALALADHFFMGVQFNYQGIVLPEYYGRASKMTGEFGIYYKHNEHWKLGAAVFNFSNSRLSDFQDDRLSSLIRIGVNYQPSSIVQIVAEINKDLENDLPYLNAGLEYQPLSSLFLRVGIGTQPSNIGFGFGYKYKRLRFDLSCRYHPTLGFLPQIGLIYSSGEK
ncbi:MAG: type IX secretion system membrane protein PorP/SprF [Bacteroidetes bacterium]|nr:type IX secretion system membrane protein PorP/SprF [Bacteroidota bacterium]